MMSQETNITAKVNSAVKQGPEYQPEVELLKSGLSSSYLKQLLNQIRIAHSHNLSLYSPTPSLFFDFSHKLAALRFAVMQGNTW